jgi:hypothetical protein
VYTEALCTVCQSNNGGAIDDGFFSWVVIFVTFS